MQQAGARSGLWLGGITCLLAAALGLATRRRLARRPARSRALAGAR
jgi:hypothetical protein